MTKKIVSLFLALTLLAAVPAFAEPTEIDGISDRNIKINRAGLNPSADDVIGEGFSPTTGRALDEIEAPDGFLGVAVTGQYQPIMVQISNSGNGVGISKSGKLYIVAPVNGSYSDVVYEAPQKKGGNETRMSMIFSDTIPDYVGFVRSTRLTHCRIRQEWDCAYCTSGYSSADVPEEWRKLGVRNPAGATPDDIGLAYVGDYPKAWKEYVWRLSGIDSANSELFMPADIVKNIVPKDHVPANHTWLFSDDLPEGGDSGSIVYVTWGNKYETDSRLEYDPSLNAYIRYVNVEKLGDVPYKDTVLVNPEIKKVRNSEGETVKKVVAESRNENELITFNNIIVQGIGMHWIDSLRPDPELTGTGNADYFMGGKHYRGVWERTDINSRTVFYGEDGNEIKLQKGRTLIILMPYVEGSGSRKMTKSEKYSVKYE